MYMASTLGQTISPQEIINEITRRGYKKGTAPISPSYSPTVSPVVRLTAFPAYSPVAYSPSVSPVMTLTNQSTYQSALDRILESTQKYSVAPVYPSYSPAVSPSPTTLSPDRVSPYIKLPLGMTKSKDLALSFAVNWALKQAKLEAYSGVTYLGSAKFELLARNVLSAAQKVNQEMGWSYTYSLSDANKILNQRGYYLTGIVPPYSPKVPPPYPVPDYTPPPYSPTVTKVPPPYPVPDYTPLPVEKITEFEAESELRKRGYIKGAQPATKVAPTVPLPRTYPVYPTPSPYTQYVTVTVPYPYTVEVIRNVPVTQYVTQTVQVPYSVMVPQPYTIEVPRTVEIPVPVPQPYTVEIPYEVTRTVPYTQYITQTVAVPQPYTVEVERPYTVEIPVQVPQPYTVEVPYEVTRTVEVPKTIEMPFPVEVPVEVQIPVEIPVEVIREVPVYIEAPRGEEGFEQLVAPEGMEITPPVKEEPVKAGMGNWWILGLVGVGALALGAAEKPVKGRARKTTKKGTTRRKARTPRKAKKTRKSFTGRRR